MAPKDSTPPGLVPILAAGKARERGARDQGRVAGRVHGGHRDRLAGRRDPVRVPDRGGLPHAADRGDRLDRGRADRAGRWARCRSCTSAPVACQEAAISPRVMPSLTIPAKVARLSASTSANAGSTPVSEDRAARDSATKPVAPAPRADQASRPRTASGYSRSMTTTTGMATSTGVIVRYRSVPPALRGRQALVVQHDQPGRRGGARGDLGHRAAPRPARPAGLGAGDPGRVAGRGGPAVLPRRDQRRTGQRRRDRDPGQRPAG